MRVSYLAAHPVGGLQPAVVRDVLPQRVLSVQRLLVDAVVAVLLHHALGLLLEGLDGGVLPPRTQVSVLVKLSAFWVENDVGFFFKKKNASFMQFGVRVLAFDLTDLDRQRRG